MNPDETLRQNVIKLREQNDWSITDLANRLGVDRTYLSKAEHGKRAFKVSEVVKLAEIFNVSADCLLGNPTRSGEVSVDQNKDETVFQALRHVSSVNGKSINDQDRQLMTNILETYLAIRDNKELDSEKNES